MDTNTNTHPNLVVLGRRGPAVEVFLVPNVVTGAGVDTAWRACADRGLEYIAHTRATVLISVARQALARVEAMAHGYAEQAADGAVKGQFRAIKDVAFDAFEAV